MNYSTNKKAPVRRLFEPEAFHPYPKLILIRRFIQKITNNHPTMWVSLLFNNYFLLYIKNSAANTAFKNKFPYTGGPEACPVAA